jgi:hypothetical protein
MPRRAYNISSRLDVEVLLRHMSCPLWPIGMLLRRAVPAAVSGRADKPGPRCEVDFDGGTGAQRECSHRPGEAQDRHDSCRRHDPYRHVGHSMTSQDSHPIFLSSDGSSTDGCRIPPAGVIGPATTVLDRADQFGLCCTPW